MSSFDAVACVFFIIIFSVLSFFAGRDVGRLEVATGEVKCVLVAQFDKTTEWECGE